MYMYIDMTYLTFIGWESSIVYIIKPEIPSLKIYNVLSLKDYVLGTQMNTKHNLSRLNVLLYN